jgi:hypothetical protein
VLLILTSGHQTRQAALISSPAHQLQSIVVFVDETPARHRCRLSFFSACSISQCVLRVAFFFLASIAIPGASCTSLWPASEARLLACSFCATVRCQWAHLPTPPLHIIYLWSAAVRSSPGNLRLGHQEAESRCIQQPESSTPRPPRLVRTTSPP